MRSADAVVVGGGIAGLTTAYHLARARQRVLVLDQAALGAAGSGRNGGHISPGIEGSWADLGLRAYALWPAFARDLGDIEFRQEGGLYAVMARDPADVDDLAEYKRRRGFDAEAWSADRCRQALPFLDATIKGGVFSPETAQVNPHAVMARLEDALRAHGAEVRPGTSVTRIAARAGAVESVRTTAGEDIATPVVVNASGAGAPAIGALAGVEVPVRPLRIQILVTEAVPRLTGTVWSGNGLYARQAVAGQLHFGAEGPPWDPPVARTDNDVTGPTLQRIAKRFVELAPGLRHVRALRSWAGVLGVSADGFPIIDAADAPRGLFTIAGLGGNGFAVGAVAGRAVADLITDGHSDLDLTQYSLRRFAPAGVAARVGRDPRGWGGTDRWTDTSELS